MAAKILLVEDDNNLREIYEARLLAEGYTIVTARDGEEALVVAKAEKPDLVISDVMMPRISGFEMLDILRNTAELKYTKVIMLTALGQADDQTRANSLGADRYLVKSQVTLEDIVKAAHELIEGSVAPATPAPVAAAPAAPAPAPAPAIPIVATPPIAAAPMPAPAPVAPEVHLPVPAPVTPPAVPATPAPAPAIPIVATPPIAAAPMPAPAPVAPEVHLPVPAPVTPPAVPATPAPAPVAPPQPRVAGPADTTSTPNADNVAETTAHEEETVHSQIENFINTNLTHPEATTSQPASLGTPPAAAADDSLLAQAVHALNAANNAGTVGPSTPPSDNPPVTAMPTPQVTPPVPTPSKPETQAAAQPHVNYSVTIANKKVIQPLKSEPKPGIDELLAREEAKQIIAPAPAVMPSEPEAPVEQTTETNIAPPAVGPPGGDIFSPSAPADAVPPPEQPSTGIDPNSIAL